MLFSFLFLFLLLKIFSARRGMAPGLLRRPPVPDFLHFLCCASPTALPALMQLTSSRIGWFFVQTAAHFVTASGNSVRVRAPLPCSLAIPPPQMRSSKVEERPVWCPFPVSSDHIMQCCRVWRAVQLDLVCSLRPSRAGLSCACSRAEVDKCTAVGWPATYLSFLVVNFCIMF